MALQPPFPESMTTTRMAGLIKEAKKNKPFSKRILGVLSKIKFQDELDSILFDSDDVKARFKNSIIGGAVGTGIGAGAAALSHNKVKLPKVSIDKGIQVSMQHLSRPGAALFGGGAGGKIGSLAGLTVGKKKNKNGNLVPNDQGGATALRSELNDIIEFQIPWQQMGKAAIKWGGIGAGVGAAAGGISGALSSDPNRTALGGALSGAVTGGVLGAAGGAGMTAWKSRLAASKGIGGVIPGSTPTGPMTSPPVKPLDPGGASSILGDQQVKQAQYQQLQPRMLNPMPAQVQPSITPKSRFSSAAEAVSTPVDADKFNSMQPNIQKRARGVANLANDPGTGGEGSAAHQAFWRMREEHGFRSELNNIIELSRGDMTKLARKKLGKKVITDEELQVSKNRAARTARDKLAKKVSVLRHLTAREELIQLKAIDLGYSYESMYGGCGIDVAAKPDRKNYPSFYVSDRPDELDIPMEGQAVIKYKLRSKEMRQNEKGEKKHSASLEIHSIDPIKEDKKPKQGERAKLVKFRAELDSIIHFGDPRKRNNLGEFSGAEGGPDPTAMGITYKSGLISSAVGGAAGAAGGLAVTKGPAAIKSLLSKIKKKK
jgi:hypothetical protein